MGQDPTLPTHVLLLGDGLTGWGSHAAEAPLTMAAQRFYHILHVAASTGEHEKVVQVITISNLSRVGVGGETGGQHLAMSPYPQTVGGDSDGAKLEEKQVG